MISQASFRSTSHLLGSVTLIGRLVQARIATLLEPHGLTHGQAVALVRLWRSETSSMPQASLIESLAVSRATGTQLLQDLEAQGLVTRRPDASDARKQVVILTQGGSDLEPPVLEVFDRVEREVVDGLRVESLRSLESSLRLMLDRAKETRKLF